jgi:hypothetical protein
MDGLLVTLVIGLICADYAVCVVLLDKRNVPYEEFGYGAMNVLLCVRSRFGDFW